MTAALTTEERWRLGYRPELDGLRGVAIGLVLVMHTTGYTRGGPVGVTLFFVLSGFLITALLVEERERHRRVDLVAFYQRRALRLLPALIVVVLGVAAWMALTGRADDVPGDIVGPLFYVSNWLAVAGVDMGLLGHTWSLSVEEHFYVVWPAVLLGALALGGERLALGVAVGGAVASLALRVAIAEVAAGQRA